MGLCLKAKGHPYKMYMGYGQFDIFRDAIQEYIGIGASDGTIAFLNASDCEGHLTHKQCIELLDDIQMMEYDGWLGYDWCK